MDQSLWRVCVGYFLLHRTFKIPSGINKPVSGSKIVGKTERKQALNSNHGWLVNILYCINYLDYQFNVCFFSVPQNRRILDRVRLMLWCCGLGAGFVFYHHAIRFGSVELIASRFLPHSKRRIVPFPVNRILRIFSCFLLANNTLKPVNCLGQRPVSFVFKLTYVTSFYLRWFLSNRT